MSRKETNIWDLKVIIGELTSRHPDIKAIYLFGSRAHMTNSRRSDIDLIVYSDVLIPTHLITDWIRKEFPPIDIFKTTDMKVAESIVNGSGIQSQSVPLDEYVNATLLWDKANGLNMLFHNWEQLTDKNVEYKMTVTGIYIPENPQTIVSQYSKLLHEKDLPYPHIFRDWSSVGESIEEIVKSACVSPRIYAKKAKSFSFDLIKLQSEYDFQNLIHFALRPLFPTIEIHPENKVCTLDGNEKFGDFGIKSNDIVIEAKHIKDSSTKNTVLKTLNGLANFYKFNPNVRLLHFFVLYDEKALLDESILKGHFDKRQDTPPIFVTFIKNNFI